MTHDDTEKSDETLMLAYAQTGDPRAFEMLYQRHRTPLFRFVRRQVRPEASAEEAYQDIWTSVINSRQRYRATALFRTWLYTIARNRVHDHFRRPHLHLVVESGEDQRPTDGTDQPEAQLEQRGRCKDVRQALSLIPDEQREVFLLKEEAALSMSQITDIIGCNEETVRSRYRYAVKKLRQLLGDEA